MSKKNTQIHQKGQNKKPKCLTPTTSKADHRQHLSQKLTMVRTYIQNVRGETFQESDRSIGTRSKGRPITEWSENMNSVASSKGKTIEGAKKLATNRKEYRKWFLTPET